MNRKKPFLNESEKNLSQDHKEYLGMEVPEGYFATSKQSILDLVKGEESDVSQLHKKELGMEVPDDYFATSKQSILDLVKEEKSARPHRTKRSGEEVPVFYLRKSFQVAASIALLVTLVVWTQFPVSNDLEIASDDALIESLFVEDESMNDFVEELLVSEVVEEAGKEKDMETVLMNSLFVEDSLLENYTEKTLLDNIIL